MHKVRVLFLPPIDADNTNAQSLNTREIALRLDQNRFECTLWYEREPDRRLLNRPEIRLLQLPARRKTLRLLREMLAGYDIISYIDYSPASYIFVHLPRMIRGKTRAFFHAEAPSAQIVNPSRSLRFLYEGIFPNCDCYSAITEFVGEDVFRRIGKRVAHILPVGVDIGMFSPGRERQNQAPVVLFAGTVIERKGPQYVLEAAANFPAAEFLIVGAARGGFDQILRAKIRELQLKNVVLKGPKTQAELLDIMRSSDIFILPSRLEGMPKVSLEAAATGLPSIVFRDYQTPSVLDGVTGFQVGSSGEMMQALGRLIADPASRSRMGIAARELAQKYDWNLVSQVWQKAFLELAGRHGE